MTASNERRAAFEAHVLREPSMYRKITWRDDVPFGVLYRGGSVWIGPRWIDWQASHDAAVEACAEACTDERFGGPIELHPEHVREHNRIHNTACNDCATAILKLKVTT